MNFVINIFAFGFLLYSIILVLKNKALKKIKLAMLLCLFMYLLYTGSKIAGWFVAPLDADIMLSFAIFREKVLLGLGRVLALITVMVIYYYCGKGYRLVKKEK